MSGNKYAELDPYSRWNLALLDWFFSPSSAGDDVWLQVSPELLDIRGSHLGGDRGFCDAVSEGPGWTNARLKDSSVGVFHETATRLMDQRRHMHLRPRGYVDPGQISPTYKASASNGSAPTYLPYLVALARAAAVDEKDGFYAVLQRDLLLPNSWSSVQMGKLRPVWEDLGLWTRACKGQFGNFNVRVLGGYAQIGLAKAQVVFSRRDIRNFGRIFRAVGLRRGQNLNEQHLREIRSEAANAYFLSKALQEAISQRGEYDDVIESRLRVLFDEWDGKDPRAFVGQMGAESVEDYEEEIAELEVCLTYDDESAKWGVHWQVPNYGDSQEILRVGESVALRTMPLDGSIAVTISDDDIEVQRRICESLTGIDRNDLEFRLSWMDDDSSQRMSERIKLRQLPLRIFTPRQNHSLGRDELGEHLLPSSGPVYLLASASNAAGLKNYLIRENISHDYLSTGGLPSGWEIAFLPDCAELTVEKIKHLPNGELNPTAARNLRLIGGRFVTRSGVRQYLSYDLPTIEVDSRDALIRCVPDGLEILEENSSTQPTGSGLLASHGSGPRRFRLVLGETSARVFQISAEQKNRESEFLRLRIASDSGEYVISSDKFALDKLGAPSRDGVGLRGIVGSPSPSQSRTTDFRDVKGIVGDRVLADSSFYFLESAPVEFLDSLAQCPTGSMAYSVARDQLRRLFARHGVEKTPGEELLNLRARGFLEIETNYKGRLVRVHAVQPTLYQLTFQFDGLTAYSILGTLRKSNWKALLDFNSVHPIYADTSTRESLPCFRVMLRDSGTATELAVRLGFLVSAPPSQQIADWSLDYHSIYGALADGAVESLGSGSRHQEYLYVNSLIFKETQYRTVPAGLDCRLYRLEDLETRQHKINVLGIRNNENAIRWAFVRDSRWGVWLALEGFSRHVARSFNRPDVSPWPMTYCREDGSVWIPARAGLPVILERALTLCGGSGPRVVTATEPSWGECDEIHLNHSVAGLVRPRVSSVYAEMAQGRWLVYRWVPLNIAERVAEKLNAKVMFS